MANFAARDDHGRYTVSTSVSRNARVFGFLWVSGTSIQTAPERLTVVVGRFYVSAVNFRRGMGVDGFGLFVKIYCQESCLE